MKKSLVFLSFCFTFGLLTSIVILVACHFIRFRPNPILAFERLGSREALVHDAKYDPLFIALPPSVELSNDNGIGFRRIEIRHQPRWSVPQKIMKCHYLTTLGWPQAIFSSGSQWLGRYREDDSSSLNVDDLFSARVVTGGSPISLHWSGIFFDTLTFSLPICVVALWVRGPRRWPENRVLHTIAVIMFAWWLGLAIPALGVLDYVYCENGSSTPKGILPKISETSLGLCQLVGKEPENFTWRNISTWTKTPSDFAQRTGSDPIQLSAQEWDSYDGIEVCGFAMSERTQMYFKPDPEHPAGGYNLVVRSGESMSAGWPMQAFRKGDSTHPILTVSDLSHLDVQWLPWLGNVAVLSAGPAVVFFTTGFIRRRRRAARGQCLACGYRLNGAMICPECGWANAIRVA